MTTVVTSIPARLKNVSHNDPYVAGVEDIIDDNKHKTQSEINTEYDNILNERVADKPASTGTTGDYPYNGMGRVELAKNMVNTGTELEPVMVNQLTQDMFYKGAVGSRVPNTNTIFVIQYDYVLGEDITIPDNCVLEFEGGSISGAYTITLNNTFIIGTSDFFDGVTLAGTIKNETLYFDWFVCEKSTITTYFNFINGASSSFGTKPSVTTRNANALECLIAFDKHLIIRDGLYVFDRAINFPYNVTGEIECEGNATLWFVNSKGFIIKNQNKLKLINLNICSWEQSLYFNANNGGIGLFVRTSRITSFTDNAVEQASGSGVHFESTFMDVEIIGGAGKAAFYNFHGQANNYIRCAQKFFYDDASYVITKGRPKAVWHNSECWVRDFTTDAMTEYICYVDSNSLFGGTSYLSFDGVTIEGTPGGADPRQPLTAFLYFDTPNANNVPFHFSKPHFYGTCFANAYGDANNNNISNVIIINKSLPLKLTGNLERYEFVGECYNLSDGYVVTVSGNSRICVLAKGGNSFSASHYTTYAQRTEQNIKDWVPWMSDSYIQYFLNLDTEPFYLLFEGVKGSTIILNNSVYRIDPSGTLQSAQLFNV